MSFLNYQLAGRPLVEYIIITLGIIAFIVAVKVVKVVIVKRLLKKFPEARAQRAKATMPIITFAIYLLGLLILLDNLGIKVSALIAGLGITGVAVALAGQAILADLFSYFAILFDKPFDIGDFVIVGEHMGVVEKIGIKTTRIKSLSGEQVVFSNSDLTNSRVKNYKKMQERRVAFKLGVVYQTSQDRLKAISTIIKDIIEKIDGTRFDRSHFASYGDFSLNFETVYYISGADYNRYMDIQQEINLAINQAFAEKGIQFAYPTQLVYLNKSE